MLSRADAVCGQLRSLAIGTNDGSERLSDGGATVGRLCDCADGAAAGRCRDGDRDRGGTGCWLIR